MTRVSLLPSTIPTINPLLKRNPDVQQVQEQSLCYRHFHLLSKPTKHRKKLLNDPQTSSKTDLLTVKKEKKILTSEQSPSPGRSSYPGYRFSVTARTIMLFLQAMFPLPQTFSAIAAIIHIQPFILQKTLLELEKHGILMSGERQADTSPMTEKTYSLPPDPTDCGPPSPSHTIRCT